MFNNNTTGLRQIKINKINNITAEELSYIQGVTSNIQTQLDQNYFKNTNISTSPSSFTPTKIAFTAPVIIDIPNDTEFGTINFNFPISVSKTYKSYIGDGNGYNANDKHIFTETFEKAIYLFQYMNDTDGSYITIKKDYVTSNETLPYSLAIDAPYSVDPASFSTYFLNVQGSAEFTNRPPDSFGLTDVVRCRIFILPVYTSVASGDVTIASNTDVFYINDTTMQTNNFISVLPTQYISSTSINSTRNLNKTVATVVTNAGSGGLDIDLKLSFESRLTSASSHILSGDAPSTTQSCSCDSFDIQVFKDGIKVYETHYLNIDTRNVEWLNGTSTYDTTTASITYNIGTFNVTVPNFRSYDGIEANPKIVFKRTGGSNKAYDIPPETIHNVHDYIDWINNNTELTCEIFLNKHLRYRWVGENDWRFVDNNENTWNYLGFKDDIANDPNDIYTNNASEYIVAYLDQRNFTNQASTYTVVISNQSSTCPDFHVSDGSHKLHITNDSDYYFTLSPTLDIPDVAETNFIAMQRITEYDTGTHGTYSAPAITQTNDGFINTVVDSMIFKVDDFMCNTLDCQNAQINQLIIKGVDIGDQVNSLTLRQFASQTIDNVNWYNFHCGFNYDADGNVLESGNLEWTGLNSPVFLIDNEDGGNQDCKISIIIDTDKYDYPKDGSTLEFMCVNNKSNVKFEFPCEVISHNKRFSIGEKFVISGPYIKFMFYNSKAYQMAGQLMELSGGDYITYINVNNNRSDPTSVVDIYKRIDKSIKEFQNNDLFV